VADVTLIGTGNAVELSDDVLTVAGFDVHHAHELEHDDSALVLGEAPGAFAMAREALRAGRDVLIAHPASLAPERLALLFAERRRGQSLFLWNERRFHPAYRFLAGLAEADATWQPRYLRHETLSQEPTAGHLIRWRALEAIALILSVTRDVPVTVTAGLAENPLRNAPDLLSFSMSFNELLATLQVGLGEAVERRETLLAAANRKAYVDELSDAVPIGLVEDEVRTHSSEERWLRLPGLSSSEHARQQCLSFVNAIVNAEYADQEAGLWSLALAVLGAMDRSLIAGTAVEVELPQGQTRLQVIEGRPEPLRPQPPPPSAA
jgi:predicted dehydrogenase